MRALEGFSDSDFRATILRAIRLLLILTAVALPICWWVIGGWRSAAMLLVGSAIAASGLWEWLRLLTGVMQRIDAEPLAAAPVPNSGSDPASVLEEQPAPDTQAPEAQDGDEPGVLAAAAPAKPFGMGALLIAFFLRLGAVVLVLYVSLRYLEGSVISLAVGLGLGVFSLTVEGLRLVKAWTM